MAFELPPDNPVQILAGQAEGIGMFVAAYFNALRRSGVPEDLAGELTMNYADHMLDVLYRKSAAQPQPPQETKE